jgi:hypothetical protein
MGLSELGRRGFPSGSLLLLFLLAALSATGMLALNVVGSAYGARWKLRTRSLAYLCSTCSDRPVLQQCHRQAACAVLWCSRLGSKELLCIKCSGYLLPNVAAQ